MRRGLPCERPTHLRPDRLRQPFSDALVDVVYTVRVREPIPEDWPLMVGDVLTNLRAALDHSVYGHAESRNQLTDKQRKALCFPIIEKVETWDNRSPGRRSPSRGCSTPKCSA